MKKNIYSESFYIYKRNNIKNITKNISMHEELIKIGNTKYTIFKTQHSLMNDVMDQNYAKNKESLINFISSILNSKKLLPEGFFFINFESILKQLPNNQFQIFRTVNIRFCEQENLFFINIEIQKELSELEKNRIIDLINKKNNFLNQIKQNNSYKDSQPKKNDKLVFTEGSGGVLFHEILGHLLEADLAIQRGPIWIEKIINKKRITKYPLNIIDIPFENDFFDDEGTKTKDNILIKNGFIKNCINTKKLKITKAPLTGNARSEIGKQNLPRMRKTFVLPNNSKNNNQRNNQLVNRTFIISKIIQGFVNPTEKGDFILYCTEVIIEKDKKTQYSNNLIISGEVDKFLEKLTYIDDNFIELPYTCDKFGQKLPVKVGSPNLIFYL
ncbi:MAG: metallopeptidase TldD-related protein [Tissierellia bacterium]|nr:metallopeptidase TldD-related protein [Tissierellia bacterium]